MAVFVEDFDEAKAYHEIACAFDLRSKRAVNGKLTEKDRVNLEIHAERLNDLAGQRKVLGTDPVREVSLPRVPVAEPSGKDL